MVTLLGNYWPDQQESMQRFASLLQNQLQDQGVNVSLLQPRPICGGFGNPYGGLGKWCGYVDKFLLFPIALRRKIKSLTRRGGPGSIVHICDQANAIYLPLLQQVPHLVTCCDLLAIRSALGDFPQHRTRWSGRQLQRSILRGLNRARRVTCISQATLADLLRLSKVQTSQADVTSMGLNYPYSPMPRAEAQARLQSMARREGLNAPASFLLHVGGNQWYKNRSGLLQLYGRLRQSLPAAPPLILAGKPLPLSLRRYLQENGLEESVLSLTRCDNEDLRALYSLASYLVFPSLEEGFGWPIIEAQACGCPVITSDKAPMTEVGSSAAIYLDPNQLNPGAEIIRSALAQSPDQRSQRVAAGLKNASLYTTEAMIEKYLALYDTVRADRSQSSP